MIYFASTHRTKTRNFNKQKSWECVCVAWTHSWLNFFLCVFGAFLFDGLVLNTAQNIILMLLAQHDLSSRSRTWVSDPIKVTNTRPTHRGRTLENSQHQKYDSRRTSHQPIERKHVTSTNKKVNIFWVVSYSLFGSFRLYFLSCVCFCSMGWL